MIPSTLSTHALADLVGVSGWRGRRCGHLLVSESEPLLYGFDVCGGEGLVSVVRSGGSVGSRPVAIMEAENPCGS